MDLRQTRSFRCDIDERGKVQILPGSTPIFRPSAGEVFGEDANAEEREMPEREQATAAQWNCFWFLAGMSAGATIVLCMVVGGNALLHR